MTLVPGIIVRFKKIDLTDLAILEVECAFVLCSYLDGGCHDNIIQNQRKALTCPSFASNDFYETSVREYTDWLAWAVTTRETIDAAGKI